MCVWTVFHKYAGLSANPVYVVWCGDCKVMSSFTLCGLNRGCVGGGFIMSLTSVMSVQVHIWPVLCQLQWLLTEYWVHFKVLVLILKALSGQGPTYLRDCASPYVFWRLLCSGDQHLLVVISPEDFYLALTRQKLFLPFPQTSRSGTAWDQGPVGPLYGVNEPQTSFSF